jgi:hypothetical protein
MNAFEMGSEITSNIFILPTCVYIRMITDKQHVTEHPGGIVEHRRIQYDEYICWDYKAGSKRYVDSKTFYNQLRKFKDLLITDENFRDKLVEEILNNDLSTFAFTSEHMY